MDRNNDSGGLGEERDLLLHSVTPKCIPQVGMYPEGYSPSSNFKKMYSQKVCPLLFTSKTSTEYFLMARKKEEEWQLKIEAALYTHTHKHHRYAGNTYTRARQKSGF